MRCTLKFFFCLILVKGTSLLYADPVHAKFQVIIFDCDGVLVDTEYLKFLAWKEALEMQGVPFSIEEYMPMVGHSSKNILSMIQADKNRDIAEEVIECKNIKYKDLQRKGVSPIQEMVNFILRLFASKQQLGIRLALASSAPKEEIRVNLQQIGLENIFDLIISGSDDLKDYVDREGTNKPKPYIYIELAKQLGVSPECCLVFEDTKAGMDAAASAGMTVIAVPNPFTLTHDFFHARQIILSNEELSSNLFFLKWLVIKKRNFFCVNSLLFFVADG